MTEHTPGPWKAAPGHAYGSRNVYGPRKAHIAEVWNGGVRAPGEAEETAEANARLIAAAPRLLAALKAMVKWNGDRWGDDDTLMPADSQPPEVAEAMRAIAKAEGKA